MFLAVTMEGGVLAQVADWLADPFCRGVFAGSSKELSISSAFFGLWQLEQVYGSLTMALLRQKGQHS